MSTLKVNQLSTTSGSGNIAISPGVGINASGGAEFVIPAGLTTERPGAPTVGSIRVNTTNSKLEFYNGSGWTQVDAEPTITALNQGSGQWPVPNGVQKVDILMVAGGGGGGSGTGGGGGAGGMVEITNYPVSPGGTIAYQVGNGGPAVGVNGGYGNLSLIHI